MIETLIFFFHFFPLLSEKVLKDKIMIDDFDGNLLKFFLVVAFI